MSHQAPLPMGFPRQEYCSGLPFPSPRIEPASPAWQVVSLPLNQQGSPFSLYKTTNETYFSWWLWKSVQSHRTWHTGGAPSIFIPTSSRNIIQIGIYSKREKKMDEGSDPGSPPLLVSNWQFVSKLCNLLRGRLPPRLSATLPQHPPQPFSWG